MFSMTTTTKIGMRSRSVADVMPVFTAFSHWCLSAIRLLTPYLFVLVFVLLSGAEVYAASTAPEIFVQQNIDKGLSVLNDGALAPRERDVRFRDVLLSVTDVKRVALFTLGPYARGASDSQINGFVSAFADFFTVVFQRDLDRNAGDTIEVTGSTVRSPDDVIVTARLTGTDASHAKGTAVNIAFRVRKNAAGADTVVDLQVEGVSMAMTERDEFTAWLQQHGGNIGMLATELENRVAHLRAGGAMAQTQSRSPGTGSGTPDAVSPRK
jgi:phospholipid transport system substrate-binding protein